METCSTVDIASQTSTCLRMKYNLVDYCIKLIKTESLHLSSDKAVYLMYWTQTGPEDLITDLKKEKAPSHMLTDRDKSVNHLMSVEIFNAGLPLMS